MENNENGKILGGIFHVLVDVMMAVFIFRIAGYIFEEIGNQFRTSEGKAQITFCLILFGFTLILVGAVLVGVQMGWLTD